MHLLVFDAVMGKGGVTVPAIIQKIETNLKKGCNKRQREARKVLKEYEGRGTKRKAEQVSIKINVNVTAQVTNTGAVQVQTGQPSTRRPRVEKSGLKTTPTAKNTATSTSPATTGKANNNKSPATKSEKAKAVPKPVKPAAKKAAAETPAQQSRPPKQGTAQTSEYLGGDTSRGHSDGPPPYSEVGPELQSSPRRGIGLLNGRYKVDCPYMGGNFPGDKDDFGASSRR